MAFAQVLLLILATLLTGCVSAEVLTIVTPVVIEWWSFFAFAALAWTAGQAAKSLAPAAETSSFWKFFWRTLPYHPVALGVLFGLVNVLPLPTAIVKAHASGSLYYGFAGVVACYAHDLWQTWVKYREEK